MATESSQVLTELLDAGFPRTTLVSVTGNNLQELSGAKMGRVVFSKKVQEKLAGLLSWVKCMKASNKFNINPAAYYEVQVVLLEVDGEETYTSLHELYETETIDAEEMKSLTVMFPQLYDYNAFADQFPTRADLAVAGDVEEAHVVLHHGLPELTFEHETNRRKAREAVVQLLERNDEENRVGRRLAS
jgi:hypothetical protein